LTSTNIRDVLVITQQGLAFSAKQLQIVQNQPGRIGSFLPKAADAA
jgi:hypothetical protein